MNKFSIIVLIAVNMAFTIVIVLSFWSCRRTILVYTLQQGRVEGYGIPDDVYKKSCIYIGIIDAAARCLNIEKSLKPSKVYI